MPVKPQYIKELGAEIRERYPDAVSTDFSHNKELVAELTNIESKPVRNRVAGYIASKERRAIKNAEEE